MFWLFASLLLPQYAVAANNGYGKTPIMGYNSYNDVGCSPTGAWMSSTMQALSSNGLSKLGYNYFQVDCGWQSYDRLANGSITYDTTAFPNGIRPLSDLAHKLGLKWSMYTDQGRYSCDTRTDKLRPGSLGYEKQDAAMFAAWNTEYVKVDNCYIDGADQNAPKDARTDFPTRYQAMWNALTSFNINDMLICQWGVPYLNTSTNTLQGPSQWTSPVSTSYRVSDDIASGWANVQRIMNEAINVNLKGLSGPGHFADMDLLEVGNQGMTLDEQKSHFAIWATFKSALMISTNVPTISKDSLAIFSNKDLIAVNQDTLGAPIKLFQRFSGDYDLFVGPLANGDQVVMLLDQSNSVRSIQLSLSDIGIASGNVKDLWTGLSQSSVASYTAKIAAHGSAVLRISNIKAVTPGQPSITYHEAESGTLLGGASVVSCTECSNKSKVGWISASSRASLTISNIRTSKASTDVYFDYINADIGYLSTQGPNTRAALVQVNGGQAQDVSFPLTGYNWDGDLLKGFKVRLSGFNVTAANRIVISGSSTTYWAPDFDRIGIVDEHV